MSIPVSGTTITVKRTSGDTTGYGATPTVSTVATGVRAVIGSLFGTELEIGGTVETVTAKLTADPCGITHLDTVVDETSGLTWQVIWPRLRRDLGLDHVEGQLRQVSGAGS